MQKIADRVAFSLLDKKVEIRPFLIKAAIITGEVKAIPPLGPILGFYQISPVEFCSKINAYLQDYVVGLFFIH